MSYGTGSRSCMMSAFAFPSRCLPTAVTVASVTAGLRRYPMHPPAEQYAGSNAMTPAYHGSDHARRFGLDHDRALFFIGEEAPTLRPGIVHCHIFQAVFDHGSVSSAASTSVYQRSRTGMETRPPFDHNNFIGDQITPTARLNCDNRNAFAYSPIVNPLQLSASTCIAQNASAA
jgi:hypothetical protein